MMIGVAKWNHASLAIGVECGLVLLDLVNGNLLLIVSYVVVYCTCSAVDQVRKSRSL